MLTKDTSQEYNYGDTPRFTGSTDKAADAQYTYTFKGWSPALKVVSGAATYTATYTETVNKYTVRFVDWNGTELESQTVAYGSDAANPTVPTRAMIVTILWRLEGEPVVNYAMDFSDVSADTWYTEAVRWAASKKIVDGWNGKFDPMGDITREQFAAILWRYAKYCGMDVSVGEDTNILSYDDAFDVAEWSIPAMRWVCGAGVIQGIVDGKATNLEPQGKATRAQAATILYRFCELTEEEN